MICVYVSKIILLYLAANKVTLYEINTYNIVSSFQLTRAVIFNLRVSNKFSISFLKSIADAA